MHEDEELLTTLWDTKKCRPSHGGGAGLPFGNRANRGFMSIHQVQLQLVLLVAWVAQDWCTATARVGLRSTDAPGMELQAPTEGADHGVRKRGRDPISEKLVQDWHSAGRRPPSGIVCKVGRMLICCTGAGTHNFQIASERLQYRMKRHVLGHIRPPSTPHNFQYSIETIFAF